MAQKIEKNISWFLILSLVMLSLGWFFLEPANSAVTVSATVASMITCTTPLTSTVFGTMSNTAVATSTPNATTTVSSNGTVYVKIKDNGDGTTNPGLYKSTATTDLIGSADASYTDTATLAAGTEGYGIQATTTGANLVIATRYLKTGTDVGGFERTDQTMASSSAAVSSEVVTVIHKAAVSAANVAGDYSDTITYTCSSS